MSVRRRGDVAQAPTQAGQLLGPAVQLPLGLHLPHSQPVCAHGASADQTFEIAIYCGTYENDTTTDISLPEDFKKSTYLGIKISNLNNRQQFERIGNLVSQRIKGVLNKFQLSILNGSPIGLNGKYYHNCANESYGQYVLVYATTNKKLKPSAIAEVLAGTGDHDGPELKYTFQEKQAQGITMTVQPVP